jgi:hypothetical protein
MTGQDSWNRKTETGQSLDRTGGNDSQDRTTETGKHGLKKCDRTARTVQSAVVS